MVWSIPRTKNWRSIEGDVPAMSDCCGTPWPRSKMRRDGDGLLRCPLHAKGRGRLELDEAVAAAGQDQPKFETHEDATTLTVDTTGAVSILDLPGFEV